MATCALCGQKSLKKFVDFGILPLGFPVSTSEKNKVWNQKLALQICTNCKLIQTVHRIPDKLLKAENLSTAGLAKSTQVHDKKFAFEIPKKLKLSKDALICEVGPGDANLLHQFYKRGFKNVFGVEPAVHKGKKYPFKIYESFFDKNIVDRLIRENKRPDLVIANYIIELIPEIDQFFANLSSLLGDNSFVVIEVPYFLDFVDKLRVDGFAHLRVLWFSINSLSFAFQRHRLKVVDITHDPNYRGGTLRIIGEKTKAGELSKKIQAQNEKEAKRLNLSYLEGFAGRLRKIRGKSRSKILKLINEGTDVYGYGAGIKSSTLVNWLGLTRENIKFCVDIDPNKHGKLVPLAGVPVEPEETLFRLKKKVVVLNLAIDHTDQVVVKLKKRLIDGSSIIHILPEFKVMTV